MGFWAWGWELRGHDHHSTFMGLVLCCVGFVSCNEELLIKYPVRLLVKACLNDIKAAERRESRIRSKILQKRVLRIVSLSGDDELPKFPGICFPICQWYSPVFITMARSRSCSSRDLC